MDTVGFRSDFLILVQQGGRWSLWQDTQGLLQPLLVSFHGSHPSRSLRPSLRGTGVPHVPLRPHRQPWRSRGRCLFAFSTCPSALFFVGGSMPMGRTVWFSMLEGRWASAMGRTCRFEKDRRPRRSYVSLLWVARWIEGNGRCRVRSPLGLRRHSVDPACRRGRHRESWVFLSVFGPIPSLHGGRWTWGRLGYAGGRRGGDEAEW